MRAFLLSVTLVGLVSCGDGDASLVRIADEPAGDHCADGGVAIASGIDADGNGVLDDDEILSTSYVCDGESGDAIATLVDTAAEPAGANCAAGGTVVRIGPDADGDGVLGDDEVDQTIYVCNGPGGESVLVVTEDAGVACADGGTAVHVGADDDGDGALQSDEYDSTTYVCNGADGGHATLIATEDAGDACEHGGTAVHSGFDDDGDGALDVGEYDATTYVCNGAPGGGAVGPVLEGSYLISNTLDLALLAGVTEITGDLRIEGAGITLVALPDLLEVGGDVLVGPAPGALSLPALTQVGGSFSVSNAASLTSLAAPVLASVGGTLLVTGTSLSALSLPALTTAENMEIYSNSALTNLDVPVLESASVYVSSNAALTTVELPALTTAGYLILYGPVLTAVTLAALTTVTFDLQLSTPALTSVDLPALTTAGSVTVTSNTLLTSLSLPALTSVSAGALSVQSNPALTSVDVSALTTVGNLAVGGNT